MSLIKGNFITGFTYPFGTIRFFFSKPKIILYSVIPVIINLIVYSSAFIFSYNKLQSWIKSITGVDENSEILINLLHYLLSFLSIMILLLICYFLFTIFGGLITAPFNEKISQLVEESFIKGEIENKPGFFEDLIHSISAELKKIIFYLILLIPVFFINFIPVAGSLISGILGLLLSCFYNALDFLDYPMTRKRLSFRKKLHVVKKGRYLTYGFGLISFLLMFLPVINVFTKPLLVVAGTSLYYEKNYERFLHETK
ncbi:MAG: EI24 domain-containing protein [Ignavibacteria bacterium]|nr:EI24 domain-containing protein [Ignavibacteria bacterium]